MYRRIKTAFGIITVCFAMLVVSIYNISLGSLSLTVNQKMQKHTDTVLLSKVRGTVYYRNFSPLAGKQLQKGVLVNPIKLDKQSLELLKENALFVSQQHIEDKINNAYPFYIPTKDVLSGKGLTSISTNRRYCTSFVCQNLLGYVNSEGNGVGGLEEHFENDLYSDEEYRLYYRTDAIGQMLDGLGISFSGPAYGIDKGIVTTLDEKIQNICEEVANEYFEKGAIVVQEVKTAKILACVSRPLLNPDVPEKNFISEGSFLNKAFGEYCCGSAFKIVVTAAALENSDEVNFSYKCEGSYNAGGVIIGCSNVDGHGPLSLKTAFAKSCNSYFCNLASQLGPVKIYETAKKLGFGEGYDLGYEFFSKKGNLPLPSELIYPAALSNLSIGQGNLLVTPIQVSNMCNTIANDGVFVYPKVIEGKTETGTVLAEKVSTISYRAISPETAKEIRDYMEYTVESGTGINAKPVRFGAGAKTSTAETGIINNGVDEYHTWITGYIPANSPVFTVTVLVEGGQSGYYSAAPVMKKIADKIIGAGLY